MQARLIGYSERGMLNALTLDFARPETSSRALTRFLERISFPLCSNPPRFGEIQSAEILVEQSFSDFGDPDLALLLTESSGARHLVFIEAKVHGDVKRGRTIERRWENFLLHVDGGRQSSSLFVQMYRIGRLIEQLRKPDRSQPPNAVSRHWSLGRNRVVQRAVALCQKYVATSAWVVALLPERKDSIETFCNKTLAGFDPSQYHLEDWKPSNWGFVTWHELEGLSREFSTEFTSLSASLNWNRELVYCGWDEFD